MLLLHVVCIAVYESWTIWHAASSCCLYCCIRVYYACIINNYEHCVICSKTRFTHNAWLSYSQSSMDTCRVAHTCHVLSIRQPITNDVMQHEVTSNIHTSHTEIRLIFHSLLLRSDVTDIHSMRWYLLGSLSINSRLDVFDMHTYVARSVPEHIHLRSMCMLADHACGHPALYDSLYSDKD